MGTNGTLAVKINGETKSTYNHYDSYPAYLGAKTLDFLRETVLTDVEAYKAQAAALSPVKGKPSAEDKTRLADFHQNVGGGDDWYALLRGTQGDLALILSVGLFEPHRGDEEWGYVVDFDAQEFRTYYRGDHMLTYSFAKLPTKDGYESDVKLSGKGYW